MHMYNCIGKYRTDGENEGATALLRDMGFYELDSC